MLNVDDFPYTYVSRRLTVDGDPLDVLSLPETEAVVLEQVHGDVTLLQHAGDGFVVALGRGAENRMLKKRS